MVGDDDKNVVLHVPYVAMLDGDILAALMLSQIVYWYRPDKQGKSKLKVHKDSKWWIAKSNVEWSEECGLTRAQTRRCIKTLQDRGIIDAQVYRFDGIPVVHIRLLHVSNRKTILGYPKPNHWLSAAIPLAAGDQSITETTTENTTESKPCETTLAKAEIIMFKQKQTAAEVLAELAEKKSAEPVAPVNLKATGIADYWRKQCRLHYDDMAKSTAPTLKELGQWRLLIKAVGQPTPELLRVAVRHWKPFTARVYAVTGDSLKPERPTLGYLLKHISIALNWYEQADSGTVTPAKTEKPAKGVVTMPPSYYMAQAANKK